jgi:hypothetical protein
MTATYKKAGLMGLMLTAVGIALYTVLTRETEEETESAAPPRVPVKFTVPTPSARPKSAPHFERKHPYPERDHAHRAHANEHRSHRGNGPGERNQIGGRSSGKTPSFR